MATPNTQTSAETLKLQDTALQVRWFMLATFHAIRLPPQHTQCKPWSCTQTAEYEDTFEHAQLPVVADTTWTSAGVSKFCGTDPKVRKIMTVEAYAMGWGICGEHTYFYTQAMHTNDGVRVRVY